MQLYVQKSTSTTLPLSARASSGGELSQVTAPSSAGVRLTSGLDAWVYTKASGPSDSDRFAVQIDAER
jgi:hypothetical protein